MKLSLNSSRADSQIHSDVTKKGRKENLSCSIAEDSASTHGYTSVLIICSADRLHVNKHIKTKMKTEHDLLFLWSR